MNNGRGGIQLPNQVDIREKRIDTEYVQPTSVNAQGPGVVQITAFGGLTKLEHAAIEIAAQQSGGGNLTAVECVDLAEAVLAECKRRTAVARSPKPEGIDT